MSAALLRRLGGAPPVAFPARFARWRSGLLQAVVTCTAVTAAAVLPLGAQIVGQQQNTGVAEAAASAGGHGAVNAAQLRSSTEFVLGKWDELQAERHGGEQYIAGALEHFQAAMRANPDSAYIAAQMADLLSRLGRGSEAAALAQKNAQQHPSSLVAHEVLGQIYLRELSHAPQPISDASSNGAITAAIATYQDLMRLDPRNADYVVILGKLYGAEGNAAGAEKQFRAALAIEPTNMDAVASLVQSLASQDRLDEARREINALPLVARGAPVYVTLGDAFASRHRYADAAAAYRQAVEADPQDTDVQKALAGALMDGGEYPQALAAYEQLHARVPEDGRVLLRLGQLQMQMGQFAAARESLSGAAKLLPSGDLEVDYATALLDQTEGHDQTALSELQALAARKNKPATQSIFLAQLARLEMRLGQFGPAQAHVEQLRQLGEAYRDQALGLEVELYAQQHDYPRALDAARAAMAAQPDSRPLQLTYANLLAASGKPDAARAAIEPLLRGTAADWDLYLALGQVALQSGNWAAAQQDTQKADTLATSPAEHARAARQMGAIEARQSEYADAERSYRRALQLQPDNAEALNALGYLLAQQGVRLDEALGYVRQALKQDAHNGAYLDSLGWIYFKMKRMPEAVSNLERAARYDQHDPAILDHLAQAYEGDGKLEQAATSWAQALADLKVNAESGSSRQRQDIQKKLSAIKVRIAQEHP